MGSLGGSGASSAVSFFLTSVQSRFGASGAEGLSGALIDGTFTQPVHGLDRIGGIDGAHGHRTRSPGGIQISALGTPDRRSVYRWQLHDSGPGW